MSGKFPKREQDNNSNWMGDKIERKQLNDLRTGIAGISFLVYAAILNLVVGMADPWGFGLAFVLALLSAAYKPLVQLVANILLAINMRRK